MQSCDGIGSVSIGGYLMRLPVAVHLQAMFECPQLRISPGQGLRLLRADRSSRRQRL